MLAGWNFVISMVSVVSGEALAFAFYLRTLLQALGLPLPINDTAPACLAAAAFLLLALRGTQLGGRLQNGFLFFFWGVTLVWIVSMTGSFCTDSFAAPGQTTGFLPCVALVWWCFAGFETCCAMGEEIEHPQVNLPRALFLSPFSGLCGQRPVSVGSGQHCSADGVDSPWQMPRPPTPRGCVWPV